jgi:hypothetical protein
MEVVETKEIIANALEITHPDHKLVLTDLDKLKEE